MPDPMPLMTRLRAATADVHTALEALPFARALADGTLPLEAYIGYLRAMAVIHGALEHDLPLGADGRLAAVWDEAMRRLPVLHLDLDHFAADAAPDIAPAAAAAVRAAQALVRRSVDAPLSLLGYVYVLEGSTLGAVRLAVWARQSFGLNDGRGLAYLAGHGEATQARWAAFAARLNGLDLDEGESAGILAAAAECFCAIHRILDALHPFSPADLGVCVTAINPEAGSHPIPQHPGALAAVTAAGPSLLPTPTASAL